MLQVSDSLLMLVDVQEKLLPAMHEAEPLLANLQRLLAGATLLGVPVLVTEQLPDKLGPTVAALRALVPAAPSFSKRAFSCLGEAAIRQHLLATGRRQILVAGIEAHVCVHQTVLDLCAASFEVQLCADAVSSRTLRNRELALARMQQEGAKLSTVEMALLEWQREAGNDQFRQLLKLIK